MIAIVPMEEVRKEEEEQEAIAVPKPGGRKAASSSTTSSSPAPIPEIASSSPAMEEVQESASGRPTRNRKVPARFGQFVTNNEEEKKEEEKPGEEEEPPRKRGRTAATTGTTTMTTAVAKGKKKKAIDENQEDIHNNDHILQIQLQPAPSSEPWHFPKEEDFPYSLRLLQAVCYTLGCKFCFVALTTPHGREKGLRCKNKRSHGCVKEPNPWERRITKSEAMSIYKLNKEEYFDDLSEINRRNPHYRSAAPTRLFLISELLIATQRFKKGGFVGLVDRNERRAVNEIERKEKAAKIRSEEEAKKREDEARRRAELTEGLAARGLVVREDIPLCTGYITRGELNGHPLEEVLQLMVELNQREIALREALTARGLELRGDSALCSAYITHGENSGKTMEQVVEVMAEMKFFFTHTDYTHTREGMYQSNRPYHDHYDYYDRDFYHGHREYGYHHRDYWDDDSDSDDEDQYYNSREAAEARSEDAKRKEIDKIIRQFSSEKDLDDYLARMNPPPLVRARLMASAGDLRAQVEELDFYRTHTSFSYQGGDELKKAKDVAVQEILGGLTTTQALNDYLAEKNPPRAIRDKIMSSLAASRDSAEEMNFYRAHTNYSYEGLHAESSRKAKCVAVREILKSFHSKKDFADYLTKMNPPPEVRTRLTNLSREFTALR